MGGIDVDLSVYEDPAPKDDSRNLLTAPALPEPIKFSRKRKLPFRPDVAVEGRKYKGRRVSRSDAELDPDTLGLFDEEELSSDDGILERGDGSPRTSPSEDVEISEYRDSESEADSLADDDLNSDRDESRASDDLRTKRDAQLEKEERLVAERLAKAEKKEAERASAVRRQRVSYVLSLCDQAWLCS